MFRSSLKEKPEDEDAEGVLPALTEGQVFEPVSASVTEHFASPPKPYTDVIFCERKEWIGIEERSSAGEEKKIEAMALLLCMKDCLVMTIMLARVIVSFIKM